MLTAGWQDLLEVEAVEELLVKQGEEPYLSLEVVVEEEEVGMVAEQVEAALKLTAEEAESPAEGQSLCRRLQSRPRLLRQRYRKQFLVVPSNPAVDEVT